MGFGQPGALDAPGALAHDGGDLDTRPGGFGGVRGEVLPAGAGAAIQVTAADTQASGPLFTDPVTGAFAADDLPAGVYRVIVTPADAAATPRVIADVVVSPDGVRDLGRIDLRAVDRGPVAPGRVAPGPAAPGPVAPGPNPRAAVDLGRKTADTPVEDGTGRRRPGELR